MARAGNGTRGNGDRGNGDRGGAPLPRIAEDPAGEDPAGEENFGEDPGEEPAAAAQRLLAVAPGGGGAGLLGREPGYAVARVPAGAPLADAVLAFNLLAPGGRLNLGPGPGADAFLALHADLLAPGRHADRIKRGRPLRVLLAATHPAQCTGYARVAHALADGLAARGVEVTYFGYQNVRGGAGSGRAPGPGVRMVDVALQTGEPLGFGFDHLPRVLARHPQDLVVLYNDLMVVNAFLDGLDAAWTRAPGAARPRLCCYMDLVHEDEDAGMLARVASRVQDIWVFSPFWRDHLAARYGVDPARVEVVSHPLGACFEPVDRAAARARLGLPRDAFVALNSNRNSYRKALDVTVRAFLRAWVAEGRPPDFLLFLNCNHACDTGYDIPALVAKEAARLGLDDAAATAALQRHVLRFANAGFVDDATLNDLYAACDVGLNTCTGEGFGLCSMEHAALGAPQLVTGVGGLLDLFGEDCVPPVERLELCRGFCAHGGSQAVPDSAEFARRLGALYRAWRGAREGPDPAGDWRGPRVDELAARLRARHAPGRVLAAAHAAVLRAAKKCALPPMRAAAQAAGEAKFREAEFREAELEVVVARHDEDLAWCAALPASARLRVYDKGSDRVPGAAALPNVGREAHTYLHHIAAEYDWLAPRTAFVQGAPLEHSPGLPGLLAGDQPRGEFAWLSERVLRCNLAGCAHHGGLPLRESFAAAFGREGDPRREFAFGAGAQFVASRERIRRRPREFYERLLALSAQWPQGAHVIERFWGLILGDEPMP